MAFPHSPAAASRDATQQQQQQQQQPAQQQQLPNVSFMFTPTSKATAEGQKGATPGGGDFRSFSGLGGRTPASGRTFGGGGGVGGGGGRDGDAGLTPPSRRRSLTPASSRQMDTPPPPPMDSLLDSPPGGGLGSAAAAPSPWGGQPPPPPQLQQQQQQQDGGGVPRPAAHPALREDVWRGGVRSWPWLQWRHVDDSGGSPCPPAALSHPRLPPPAVPAVQWRTCRCPPRPTAPPRRREQR